MNKYFFLISTLVAISLCSCNSLSGEFWGETKYYKDFPGCKYEPVKMHQTLTFDFNDDAKRLLKNSPLQFEVVEKNKDGNLIPANDILLYINNSTKPCEGNRFSITSEVTELPLCIVFKNNAREGNHTLFLREVGNNGLDRIDYMELSQGFVVNKKEVTNPLKLGISWSLICLATILLCWILIVRFVTHPKTPFNKIGITYPNGEEVLVKMNNAHELICTPKKQKCSLLHGLFLGKITYQTNEYWTRPVTIKKGRTRNDIKISSAVDVVSGDLNRHSTIVICNENNEKATLEIY